MEECPRCRGKNKKNGYPELKVNGKKYRINLNLGNTKVCKECAEGDFLFDFNKLEKQILKKGEGIVIDWEFYSNLEEEVKTSLSRILVALGVLAYQSQGNWEIAGRGKNLNPKIKGQPLYFKKESDVREFARLNYQWNFYCCEIRRISRVIKQEEFST